MLSDKEKQNLLHAALVKEYDLKVETPKPQSLTIEEVFDDRLIYNIDGNLYEATYELADGEPQFGDPKKVTSTKIFTQESLSMENRRTLLDAALATHLNLGDGDFAWIEDMTETEVVYNRDRQSFKAPYVIAEDSSVTIGDSVKVTRQVTYKPIESLQSLYSEAIQEVGTRNIGSDNKAITNSLKLCQEVLDAEAPAEKDIKAALTEVTKVLTLVREQAVMKTEDGVQFPAAAFAYVPDAEKSSTWKLRLWEDLEKKVTRAQLGAAAAAFSPGGFRGQKVQIPSEDVAVVKRKIRQAYRTLGVEVEDIPRSVRESWVDVPGKGTVWSGVDVIRDKYPIYTPLTEAKAFDEKGRATVIVIKAGFNADKSRYYPAEMLKHDFGIFEGLKMYADHPTQTEDKELPERSMKSSGFVAKLVDVTCDENGTVTGVADIIEDWLMKKLANMRDKQMLSEMGISINALGRGSKATIEGIETLVIEELTGARSVDFVTEPGANGIVTLYESDKDADIDLIELSALKEKRPDLVKLIEADVRAAITKEVKKAMENEERITDLEGQVATLTTERDGLKETTEKAEKDKAIAEAQATVKEAVDKAELPVAAKERLIERFKDAESADGVAEAIQSEVDYIAKLSEAGKVKGFGPTKEQGEKDTEALRESFKRSNPDWTDEQLDVAVTGR